ncbi:hypothetical protein HN587_06540 [Candidatus Woesearchaeota archaeon]|jgi:hypothetical protein|nr:hypothetical protein [Candidatus Woesearchaeota archaeon]
MQSKKAQGLSLNMIIVAVIVLIVLVVLVMVFTGKIQFFNKGVGTQSDEFTSGKKCEMLGTLNKCVDDPSDCSGGVARKGEWDCGSTYCCMS